MSTVTDNSPIAKAAGFLAWIILGAAVAILAGWLFRITPLVLMTSEQAPVQFNTALCFALSALAIILLGRNHLTAVRLTAVAVAAFTALTFAQYLFSVRLGLDELFFDHYLASHTAVPGRMAPATAMAFILTAIATAVLSFHRRFPWTLIWTQALAAVAAFIAAHGFLDRTFDSAAAELTALTAVAPQTAVLFVLLAAALVALAHHAADSDAPLRLDRYAAWCSALLIGLVFALWQMLERDVWHERRAATRQALEDALQYLEFRIDQHADAIQRLADHGDIYGMPSREHWERGARYLLRDLPALDALKYVDTNLVVRWRVSRDGNGQELIGTRLQTGEGRAEAFAAARTGAGIQLTPPLNLHTGGFGIAFIAPIQIQQALQGYVTSTVHADDLVQLFGSTVERDFGITLRHRDTLVAGEESPLAGRQARLEQRAVLSALGQTFVLEAWPRPAYLGRAHTHLPLSILLLGLLIAILVGAAFLQARRSVINRARADELAARLTQTFESITDGLATFDREWRFTYLNEKAVQLLGRSRAELLNRRLWEALPGVLGSAFQANYEHAVATRETVRFTEFFAPLSKWFEVNAYPTPDGLAVYFLDVTARKEAEQALRASNERFHLLAKATNDVIWDWDIDSGTVWWNEGLQLVFGYAPGALGNGREAWLNRVHPDDRERIQHSIAAVLASPARNWTEEYRFQHADGRFLSVIDRGFVIRDETGRPLRMLGAMIDVTERRDLDQRLRQSQKLEAVGQLTGGVAHDFNNLLTVILGNAEILSDSLTDQQQLRLLAEMTATAAERGAELTNRLLAFARQQALQPQAVDINRLAAGMENMIRRTVSEEIDIEFVRTGGLWLAEVDPGQLEAALLNLVINARDAMPDGGRLTVETANATLDDAYAAAQQEVRAGQYVMIAVSDTGAGMGEETLGKAFEPFFTTKGLGKGSGLGLSMVYGFVKQSGGHARIYSEPGQGTTVKLYLPRATAPARPIAPKLHDSDDSHGDEHVLVVEDDPLVRDHVVAQLEALGYRVTAANDGPAALTIIEQETHIDLLFTDVVMPGGLSGRQLADAAQQIRPHLKVLFTSGYSKNAIVHHGRLDRGVELLGKPYRRQELAAKVRKVLDGPD
ncbi:MAG: PAS domain S-box protein [Gammaproteobacteria bacterium]